MDTNRPEQALSSEEIRAEIEQLRASHAELEARLDELNSHVYLTPAEQVEEHRIKKLKLQKKDRIHQLEHLLGIDNH
jgi:hypothetical protein